LLINVGPHPGGPAIEADLLVGVLSPPDIAAPLADHKHGHSLAQLGGAGLGLVALVVALGVWLRGRERRGWGRKYRAARADSALDELRQEGPEIAPKAGQKDIQKDAQIVGEQGGQA
jgi:hypothetical protein